MEWEASAGNQGSIRRASIRNAVTIVSELPRLHFPHALLHLHLPAFVPIDLLYDRIMMISFTKCLYVFIVYSIRNKHEP
jgi:hypothetical protein